MTDWAPHDLPLTPTEQKLVDDPILLLAFAVHDLLLGNWPDWRVFRDMRARTSRTYNEDVALEVVGGIPRFLAEVVYLRGKLRKRLA